MWPDGVVVVAPEGRIPPCNIQGVEYLLVQQLIAQAAIELLDESVLLRPAKAPVSHVQTLGRIRRLEVC